jgi:hypothetical protein
LLAESQPQDGSQDVEAQLLQPLSQPQDGSTQQLESQPQLASQHLRACLQARLALTLFFNLAKNPSFLQQQGWQQGDEVVSHPQLGSHPHPLANVGAACPANANAIATLNIALILTSSVDTWFIEPDPAKNHFGSASPPTCSRRL